METNKMIRIEVKTPHTSFVACEDTMEEAKSYIAAIVSAGGELVKVEYFDNDERVANIRAGKF
jgi:hypothetical protein